MGHLDTSFHDHEMGRDAEGRAERQWLGWLKQAEKLTGISNLDGDEDRDGYSLDTAHDYYEKGESPASYAAYVRGKLRGCAAAEDWISANERLPEIGAPVLLGNASWPRACIGEYKGGDDWTGYLDQNEELPVGDPTHWMPLPALPAEVQA